MLPGIHNSMGYGKQPYGYRSLSGCSCGVSLMSVVSVGDADVLYDVAVGLGACVGIIISLVSQHRCIFMAAECLNTVAT